MQGNLTGPALGTVTLTNGYVVGSQVYQNPIFGTPYLVTTPGWYSFSASFLGFYNSILIDNTGTIIQLGGSCIGVI